MKITYREMQDSDKSSIIKMFYDFCEIYKELDKQKISINSIEYASWCLQDMIDEINKFEGKIIVASENNLIFGFIGFFVREAQGNELYYHRPHKFGVVYDLFVEEKYRNHEIGTKLLDLAEQFFIKKNCEFSKLQVFGTNEKAIKFYIRHNYQVRNIDLIKKM